MTTPTIVTDNDAVAVAMAALLGALSSGTLAEMRQRYTALCDALAAQHRAHAAEVARLTAALARAEGALETIAFMSLDVAPGMDAASSYRLTAGDCIRTAMRARDAARAASDPAPAAPGGGA